MHAQSSLDTIFDDAINDVERAILDLLEDAPDVRAGNAGTTDDEPADKQGQNREAGAYGWHVLREVLEHKPCRENCARYRHPEADVHDPAKQHGGLEEHPAQ